MSRGLLEAISYLLDISLDSPDGIRLQCYAIDYSRISSKYLFLAGGLPLLASVCTQRKSPVHSPDLLGPFDLPTTGARRQWRVSAYRRCDTPRGFVPRWKARGCADENQLPAKKTENVLPLRNAKAGCNYFYPRERMANAR